MDADQAAPSPPSGPTTGQPAAPDPAADAHKTPVKKPGWGQLSVRSKVPGYLFIDGKNTGKTTPARLKLAPGRHEVVVLLKESNVKITQQVDIKAGKRTTLRLKGVH